MSKKFSWRGLGIQMVVVWHADLGGKPEGPLLRGKYITTQWSSLKPWCTLNSKTQGLAHNDCFMQRQSWVSRERHWLTDSGVKGGRLGLLRNGFLFPRPGRLGRQISWSMNLWSPWGCHLPSKGMYYLYVDFQSSHSSSRKIGGEPGPRWRVITNPVCRNDWNPRNSDL